MPTDAICRHAVIEDAPALGHVWVEAWRAAYAGLMPAEYLAGLDPMDGGEKHDDKLTGFPPDEVRYRRRLS